ncbi:hypothetical protein MGYG_04735 [Nannizzia gypsea CBS 118893]|uniref:Uncharacterized protein n=1 Tax=Arthroderma gypseum (strain ATCC MYA-4604 / CBS 118893) TaxID=535722 RepID=E4UWH8_ARTGP|nr:hypothetical protein MGYG_04735 [Nannizzia gypsea CBS 118893]EFR01734.1 hypothetical protein MGYG_04735 [Nannizzia gypsea CBS 118893]
MGGRQIWKINLLVLKVTGWQHNLHRHENEPSNTTMTSVKDSPRPNRDSRIVGLGPKNGVDKHGINTVSKGKLTCESG